MFRSDSKFSEFHASGLTLGNLTAPVRFRIIAGITSFTSLFLLWIEIGNPLPALAQIIPAYITGIAAIPLTLLAVCLVVMRCRALFSPKYAKTWKENNGSVGYLCSLNLIDIFTSFCALALTISCFTIYKSQVISVNGYHFDKKIGALDRWLLLGNDGWALTHALLPEASSTKFLDFLYHPAFLPMIIGYIACACLRSRRELRYTYINSFLISFVIIGMIFANRFSSAGPVYDGLLYGDGSTFGDLQTTLKEQSNLAGPFFSQMAQRFLFDAYASQHLRLGAGISAMPSMHVVMAFLWVFAAWPLNRFLGVLTGFYACVIWFSSVHLGWHYFSDGLVGLGFLSIIWWGTAKAMHVNCH